MRRKQIKEVRDREIEEAETDETPEEAELNSELDRILSLAKVVRDKYDAKDKPPPPKGQLYR